MSRGSVCIALCWEAERNSVVIQLHEEEREEASHLFIGFEV